VDDDSLVTITEWLLYFLNLFATIFNLLHISGRYCFI